MTDKNWYVQVGKLYAINRRSTIFDTRGLIQLEADVLVVVMSIKPNRDGWWVRLLTPCGRVGGKYFDLYEMTCAYWLKNP